MMRFYLTVFLIVGLSSASVDNNGISDESSEEQNYNKPKPHIVGGVTPLDLTNLDNLAKVQNLTDFSIKMLNQKSNDLFHSSRIRVVDASRQLVAGLKYKITFYMGQTECAKNRVRHEELTQSRCPISDKTEAKFNKCTVTVWEKPWEKYVGMFDDSCNSVPREEAMQSANQESSLQRDVDKTLLLRTNSLKSLAQSRRASNAAEVKQNQENLMTILFGKFMTDYNKTYNNETELQKRYNIFKKNMKIVQSLQYNEKGTAVYGATIFSDLTLAEFTKQHTGYVRNSNRNIHEMVPEPLKDIPDSFDWREKGAVTEVKNQGSCGSCWAFSTTGNIEGVWKVKKGQLVSLSEQQLVDCDKIDQGCGGGEMGDAYKEIERMGGLETEQEYPYQGVQRKCAFNKTEAEVYINDSIALPKDEKQMAQYLYENGPIAIAINAYPMMFYFGGISHPWKFLCSPSHLNHGVSIVGYGVEGNKPFWIIKNSWGKSWGEHGYIRLFRGAGVCGVDQDASSVIVN